MDIEGLKIEYGVIFNHKKVARIMKKYYLKPEYIKRTRPNIYRRIEENVQPNILKRNFKTDKPNKKWVTDITYLIFHIFLCNQYFLLFFYLFLNYY